MSEPQSSQFDELFSAYLEGTLDPEGQQAFDDLLRADHAARRQVELQARIEQALAGRFASREPGPERWQQLAEQLDQLDATQPGAAAPAAGRALSWISVSAVVAVSAAVLLWALGGWLLPGDRTEPFFAPQPLGEVYAQTLANGFEPYYECREEERFAEVFARRQGVPLKLLPMPTGAVMLGLSYPGGLSRDTTAILCRVEDQPVMVFVDRVAADLPLATAGIEPPLHVHRSERAGLVFYEVTPWDEPRMTALLAVARAER